jgi:hypothetical protein
VNRALSQRKLETDCQVLAGLLAKHTNQKSEIDPLLEEMDVLSWSFEACDLHFISRNCKRLFHECARLTSRDNQVVEWLINPPGLRDIIDADCNLFMANI